MPPDNRFDAMKQSLRRLGCAGVVLLTAAAMNVHGSSAAQTVDRLHWLTGCWQAIDGQPGSGEFWTSSAGGSLFGISRTVHNGETVAHEFMEIRAVGSRVVFVAHPSGQKPATFEMTAAGVDQVIFENLKHDFPQRISYKRQSENRLVAAIEGPASSGGTKHIEFPFTRSSCSGVEAESEG